MASLRKKPSPDVVVATADTANPVAVAINTDAPTEQSSTPSPEPVAPQDEAATALKRQVEALRQAGNMQQQAAIAALAAQERRQAWLASNELAQKNYAALNHIHNEALQSGLADTSPEYFSYLNNRLASLQSQHPSNAGKQLVEEMQQRAAQDRTPEPPQPKPMSLSAAHVSAPVSRDIPSGGNGQRRPGSVTLTPDQLDAARISGVSPADYAKQLLRLNEMKAAGEYSERR